MTAPGARSSVRACPPPRVPTVLPALRASTRPWALSLGTHVSVSFRYRRTPSLVSRRLCLLLTVRMSIPALPLRGSATLVPSPGRSGGPTAAAGSVGVRFREAFGPERKAVCPDHIPSPQGGLCLLIAVAFVFLHPEALLSISFARDLLGPCPLTPPTWYRNQALLQPLGV